MENDYTFIKIPCGDKINQLNIVLSLYEQGFKRVKAVSWMLLFQKDNIFITLE